MTIRIGVQLHPQHAEYDDIRRAAIGADELGVDIIYNWDHFFPLYGDASGKHFECWTMLASFAEVTERAEIGALVTCNSYRNPDLLADMARTIDHMSNGRLILGIGAGWFKKDYEEYGYDFGTAGDRLSDLRDALPRIQARWEALNPPPTRKIPILIGGGGEKRTLRYTARHADIWHGFGDADTLRHKISVLHGWCEEEGRDPSEIEISSEVRSGSPEDAEAKMAVGVTQFDVPLNGPDYDMSSLVELLAWRDEKNA